MSCDCDDNSTSNNVESTSIFADAASDLAPSRICKKCFLTWLIILIVVIALCSNRKES